MSTAVQNAVSQIREQILERNEDGWYIGAEDDLLGRLGVSRPTLRQALRILEHEGLVSVRRGVNGGLYGHIPESSAVARLATVYLRSRGTTTVELMVAVGAISAEIARLAASSPARKSLLSWVEDCERAEPQVGGRRILELALEFGRRLADLSENAPLRLFEEVINELALAPTDVRVFTGPERIELTRRHHRRMAEAIADGDGELAVALSRSHTATVMEWLH